MPFTEVEPPNTFPLGKSTVLLFNPCSGIVLKFHNLRLPLKRIAVISGTFKVGSNRPFPPASIRRILKSLFSDNLQAKTQPAAPPPTII